MRLGGGSDRGENLAGYSLSSSSRCSAFPKQFHPDVFLWSMTFTCFVLQPNSSIILNPERQEEERENISFSSFTFSPTEPLGPLAPWKKNDGWIVTWWNQLLVQDQVAFQLKSCDSLVIISWHGFVQVEKVGLNECFWFLYLNFLLKLKHDSDSLVSVFLMCAGSYWNWCRKEKTHTSSVFPRTNSVFSVVYTQVLQQPNRSPTCQNFQFCF